ncbi:MAG: ATP-binding protein [Planctomycetota bacterium]
MLSVWIAGAAGGLIGLAAGALCASSIARRVVRRAVARERVQTRRAAQSERMAELGSMTGGLAHEIKNPLSTIGLNAQLLAEGVRDLGLGGPDAERLARRTDAVRREVERLRGILEDFLEYAGELHVEPRATDLGVLVEELADFFSPQAQAEGVRLSIAEPGSGVVALADPAHLKQALLNLMLNALQAMRVADGDRPRELILRVVADPGRGGSSQTEHGAAIHVIDTGPGMASDVRERMFQPYFTTKAGGSGLGLPTTRRIIEAHNGSLEVHSEPGRGTDFVVRLPVPGALGPGTPDTSTNASGGRGDQAGE